MISISAIVWHEQWVKDGQGMMAHKYVYRTWSLDISHRAHSGLDAGIKWRPSEQELQELGPAFAGRWKEYFADKPDKPVIFFCPLSMYVYRPPVNSPDSQGLRRFIGDPTSVPPRKYFCMGYFPAYPKAMGHVHIRSGDVSAALDFETAYCRACVPLPLPHT